MRETADVILAHRWTVDGGTATGAWWRCSCGATGEHKWGLREEADRLAAVHVAEMIAEVRS